MKFNHVIKYSNSQFRIPKTFEADGKSYSLADEEAKMLKDKLEQVYRAYIDSHVDNAKES